MTEDNKQQGIKIEDATLEQLKAAAFDTEQQIKGLQRQYQILLNEIQKKLENGISKE